MNRYNIYVIFALGLLIGSITFFVIVQFETKYNVLITSGIFTIFTLISLSLYDYLITKRLKTSFGRFITQIQQGNFESSKSKVIQKYDFVNLTDIQVELSQMVGQIQADSKEQKRYIENVSHELMTPIAIIRGKLELLLQSPNIEKYDFKLINDILLKLDRLTKVNQSLVLLSKIDYNHYTTRTEVNFNEILDETLNLFEDQIRMDELTIRKSSEQSLIYDMNESLAYILVKNIIKNAVIHNINKGYITINQTETQLTISNSGENIETSTEKLFERFQVVNESEESIGLGLSIIDKICELHNIQLAYNHTLGIHSVTLSIQ